MARKCVQQQKKKFTNKMINIFFYLLIPINKLPNKQQQNINYYATLINRKQ